MNAVLVPKNGSTSIAAALGIIHEHKRASEIPRPRFAVVRHPLDRLVSGHAHAWQRDSTLARELRRDTIEEFLASQHLVSRPQSWWLDDDVDFIARFEQLDEDFARVSDISLNHHNASKHRHWSDELDAPTVRLAVQFYTEDFRRFGYEVPHVS